MDSLGEEALSFFGSVNRVRRGALGCAVAVGVVVVWPGTRVL